VILGNAKAPPDGARFLRRPHQLRPYPTGLTPNERTISAYATAVSSILACFGRSKNRLIVVSKQMRRLPRTMIDTRTWDGGKVMAAHKKCTVATDVAVYFCDPKSP
jgi:hypothetical protein